MGKLFRDFLNKCAEYYGDIIEANYYGGKYATIKIATFGGDVITLNISLEEKKDA